MILSTYIYYYSYYYLGEVKGKFLYRPFLFSADVISTLEKESKFSILDRVVGGLSFIISSSLLCKSDLLFLYTQNKNFISLE
jgi:hypothetical protein